MKKLFLFAGIAALIFSSASYAEENASTNQWSAKNLVYGPATIGYSVALPLGMGITSSAMNYQIADDDWRSAITLPYSMPAGFVCGAVYGTFLTPVYLLEGVFDTLTLGYFYPEHSDWMVNYLDHTYATVGKFIVKEKPLEAKAVEEETEEKEETK